MRTLTLHQPWATLIADGVKTIETRSWAPPAAAVGERLAIHASMNVEPLAYLRWLEEHLGDPEPALEPVRDRVIFGERSNGTVYLDRADLPFGAIVASCTLVAAVPMVGADDRTPLALGPSLVLGCELATFCVDRERWGRGGIVEDQRPYGDFAPGRWAWLLEDVKPTTERCPACWGTGWRCDVHQVGACGVCDLDDAASGCPVCTPPAGCGGAGTCEPIAARGRQRVWNWTPMADFRPSQEIRDAVDRLSEGAQL